MADGLSRCDLTLLEGVRYIVTSLLRLVHTGLRLKSALLASSGPSKATCRLIEPSPGFRRSLECVGRLSYVRADGAQAKDNDIAVLTELVFGLSSLERSAFVDLEFPYVLVPSRVGTWNLIYG